MEAVAPKQIVVRDDTGAELDWTRANTMLERRGLRVAIREDGADVPPSDNRRVPVVDQVPTCTITLWRAGTENLLIEKKCRPGERVRALSKMLERVEAGEFGGSGNDLLWRGVEERVQQAYNPFERQAGS